MQRSTLLSPVSLLAMGVAFVPQPASADTWSNGYVFASVGSGNYDVYNGSGTFVETLTTGLGGFTTGGAFDSTGNFYGTNFSNDFVTQFTVGHPHTAQEWFTTDDSSSVESILFNAAGEIYVGQADGTQDILHYSAGGAFLGRFNVATDARGSDWIDLASDQTTMFYTSEGRRIMRYDVGSDTQLGDFATLLGNGIAFALRLLGDGGLLVADNSNVKRLDSTGAVIQTYDVDGEGSWFSLNLDPDGTSFWSGNFGTGNIYQFDIASGSQLQLIETGSSRLFGVSVFGEVTQGQIPAPGGALLGVIGLGLLALTTRRSGPRAELVQR